MLVVLENECYICCIRTVLHAVARPQQTGLIQTLSAFVSVTMNMFSSLGPTQTTKQL